MRERQCPLLRFGWEVICRVGEENDVCFVLCDVGVDVKTEFQTVEVRTRWVADQTALKVFLLRQEVSYKRSVTTYRADDMESISDHSRRIKAWQHSICLLC